MLQAERARRCCSWRKNKRKDRHGLSKGLVSKHVVKDFVKGNSKKIGGIGGVLKGRLDSVSLAGKALKCILL